MLKKYFQTQNATFGGDNASIRGSAAGILLAGASVLTIIAAIAGLVVQNRNVTQQSEAQVVAEPAEPATSNATAPNPNAIEGEIRVYSCLEPTDVIFEYCNNEACAAPIGFGLKHSAQGMLNEQGVWLEDKSEDRTYVYRYRMLKFDGKPLEANTDYFISQAHAMFTTQAGKTFSNREDVLGLKLQMGSTTDFTINAMRNCGCPFKATAYVKNAATGAPITTFASEPLKYGTINNKQTFKPLGRLLDTPFDANGQIVVNVPDLGSAVEPKGYGHDALANIKLVAPGWKVVKQKCESNGKADACPIFKKTFEKNAADLPRSDIFENVRVGCNVDVTYGWFLEQLPTPMPTKPQEDEDDGPGGNVYVRGYMTNLDSGNPPSCKFSELAVNNKDTFQYLGGCSMRLENEAGTTVQSVSYDSHKPGGPSGCAEHVFYNVPAGKYTLKVDDTTSTLKNGCTNERTFTVSAGKTSDVPLVMTFNVDRCSGPDDIANTCSACKDDKGQCLQRVAPGQNRTFCCVAKDQAAKNKGAGASSCENSGYKCTGDISGLKDKYGNNGHGQPGCTQEGKGTFVWWCDGSEYTSACCKAGGGSSGGGGTGGGGSSGVDPTSCGADGSGNTCLESKDCSGSNVVMGRFCFSSPLICCKTAAGDSAGGGAGSGSGGAGSGSQNPEPNNECEKDKENVCRPGGCVPGHAPVSLSCGGAGQSCCKKQFKAPEKTECEKANPKNVCLDRTDSCGFGKIPVNGLSCGTGRSCCIKKEDAQTQQPPNRDEEQICKEYDFYEPASKCDQKLSQEKFKKYMFCQKSWGDAASLCYDRNKLCESIPDIDRSTCTVDYAPENVTNAQTCLEDRLLDGEKLCCRKNEKWMLYDNNKKARCVSKSSASGEWFAPETTDLDLNGDGVINTIDALLITDFYGEEVTSATFNAGIEEQNTQGGASLVTSPDINSDGVVNSLDLSYLLDAFGTSTEN